MIITQADLINEIANEGGIDVSIVRTVFGAAESIILGHLSSVSPTRSIVIKLLNGLKITGKYVSNQASEQGEVEKQALRPHIRVKAHMTQHYNRKLNRSRGYAK